MREVGPAALLLRAARNGPNVQCSYATESDFEEQHWTVLIRANQFNTISEWIMKIMNMTASHARDVAGFCDRNSRGKKRREQRVVVPAAQRGMRFLRRPKILFDPEVYLHGTTLKPAAAALCQFRRLRD